MSKPVELRKYLTFLLLTTVLLLGGCTRLPAPGAAQTEPGAGTALYLARELGQPMISEQAHRVLETIVKPFLPEGASLTDTRWAGPAGPADQVPPGTGPFRLIDLSGDGLPEIVAGYRIGEGRAGVMVLQSQGENWEKIWQEEGRGQALERLQVADVTGDGRGLGRNRAGLAWRGDGLEQIAQTGYHRLDVLGDVRGLYGRDGKARLAVWQKDTGDAMAVEVLRWDGEKLTPDD